MLILVIDDDELSRELLTLLLEVEGYTVVSAASGSDGLLRLGELDPPPAAVLSDLQMPGVSGTELAVALRAALPAGVPVIAMSGSDSRPPGAPVGAPEGFDGFLLKPFAAADLRAVLGAADDPGSGKTVSIQSAAAGATGASPAGQGDESEPAALDEDIFLKMQELMPPAQLGQMFALCIADARSRMAAMSEFSRTGDADGYRREAHAIKGGAGMIGAAEIYRIAARAENDGLGLVSAASPVPRVAASAGTSRVTAVLEQLSRACEGLERILVERLRT